jgi:uncharacterized phage infection (PIP) family protein YhgE
MLSLDQVRLLENRVQKAVSKIQSLTAENTRLASQLSASQARVRELEGLVTTFKDDQGRIEQGILNALDRLSAYEDSVYNSSQTETLTVSDPEPAVESILEPVPPVTLDSVSGSGETTPPVEDSLFSEAFNPGTPEDTESTLSFDIPSSGPAQIEIEAEWQESPGETGQTGQSPDGQMDIF